MKFKVAKYLFIIFVITILGVAIYLINNRKNNNIDNSTENQMQQTQYAKDLKFGISNFDTINPLISNNKEVLSIDKLIFEPLLELDEQYKIKMCLAKEYAKTTPTTYIIKIDTNIQWQNGTYLSAQDVVYTINTIKSSNSIYKANVSHIVSAEVVSKDTVKIEIDEETPFFEYNLIFPIVCENYYANEDYFQSAKVPIGTGCFSISAINQNSIILVKNPNWHNIHEQNSICETIYIYLFEQMGEVYNCFKIGNIDFINTSNSAYAEHIGTIGYYTREYPGREVDFLSLNCEDNILNDSSVRKAINYAIDRSSIVSTVYNNSYYVSGYPIDYNTFAYIYDAIDTECAPELAKSTLIDNGWVYTNNKWKKDGKTLSLTISVNNSNEQRVKVAELIKTQLEDIGISVNIKKISDTQYQDCLQNKNYQILLTGVTNSLSPDLTYFYDEGNIANYHNEEVQEIIDAVYNITDEKLLLEKYKKLIQITRNEVPYICLYRNKNTFIINQNVGTQAMPNNYSIFYNFFKWYRE